MYKYHITLFWNFMNHLIPFSHHFCIFYYYKLNQNALLKQEANLPPWVNDMIFEQLIKLSTCLISHFSQDHLNTLERFFSNSFFKGGRYCKTVKIVFIKNWSKILLLEVGRSVFYKNDLGSIRKILKETRHIYL